jgi:hypothetical protein
MAAHGKADKHSKRQESNRRVAKLKVVKVAVVGKGARERLVEIGVAEQVIVATSSKEGIVSAVKTALKLSEDVVCYDFERSGLSATTVRKALFSARRTTLDLLIPLENLTVLYGVPWRDVLATSWLGAPIRWQCSWQYTIPDCELCNACM